MFASPYTLAILSSVLRHRNQLAFTFARFTELCSLADYPYDLASIPELNVQIPQMLCSCMGLVFNYSGNPSYSVE